MNKSGLTDEESKQSTACTLHVQAFSGKSKV